MADADLARLEQAWSALPEPRHEHPEALRLALAGTEAARATEDLYAAWLWLSRADAAAAYSDDPSAQGQVERHSDAVRQAAQTPQPTPRADRDVDTDALDALALKGNELLAADDWRGAIAVWQRGLAMLPQPRDEQPEAMWFHASIGDAHHSGGEWANGEQELRQALRCAGGVGNAYVWLRLGQCLMAQGDRAGATEALMGAYLLEGEEIFDGDDPESWDLLIEQGLVEY